MSLELAIRYAKRNPIKALGRSSISRFCCVLTDGHTFIVGFNSLRTDPLQAFFSKKVGEPEKVFCHAEVHAIKKGLNRRVRFEDYTMYVARVLADGTEANSKPCPGCMAAIIRYGIKKVIHT